MPWRNKLGEGSFNVTYLSDDNLSVLKVQKDQREATDRPDRSVRVWSEINPTLRAEVVDTEHGRGWVCPNIVGRQATDREMSGSLLDIYNRTGRIVVDAPANRNFLTTARGDVICVDIGMAMQMEQDEERLLAHGRRRSIVSIEAWRGVQHRYDEFFEGHSARNPETVETIKALLFIRARRPDIHDVSFLRDNAALRRNLAESYDDDALISPMLNVAVPRPGVDLEDDMPAPFEPPAPLIRSDFRAFGEDGEDRLGATRRVEQAERRLEEVRPITLANTIDSCVVELMRYVNSRGSLDSDGNFVPSTRTKLFRDVALTTEKVQAILNLIRTEVRTADNIQELKIALNTVLADERLTSATFSSGLEAAVNRCLVNIAATEKRIEAGLEDELNASPRGEDFDSP